MPCDRKRLTFTIDIDDAPVSERVLLRDVLDGRHLSGRCLRKCSTHNLENILLKVLNIQGCAKGVQGPKRKPGWRPEDVLPYNDIHVLRYQVNNFIMSWHAALSVILESCVQYYKDRITLNKAPSPTSLLTAFTSSALGSVPTSSFAAFEPTSSLVISLPIPMVVDTRMSPMVVLTDVLSSPSLLPLSVTTQSKSLLSSSTTNTSKSPHPTSSAQEDTSPYVVLKDVLKCKYPIYEKRDYMNFLKLQASNISAPSQQATNLISAHYPYKIPFSSVCGMRLLADGRYLLNEHNYERKKDWTDAYLREERTPSPLTQRYSTAVVTFKQRKTMISHLYKFPRRQQRQQVNAMHRLEKAFCRPLKVRMKRMTIPNDQLKEIFSKGVSVRLDRSAVDRFRTLGK